MTASAKGFGIYVKNDLLESKHVEKMGTAVWLYMWLLDHITSISEEGTGKILGGKPIKYEIVEEELGISHSTYVDWVNKLRDAKYINTLRTPYGLIIEVKKAVKIFGNKKEKSEKATSIEKSENPTSNKDNTAIDNTYNTFTKVNEQAHGIKRISELLRKFKPTQTKPHDNRISQGFQFYAYQAADLAGLKNGGRGKLFDIFKKNNYGEFQVKKTKEIINYPKFLAIQTEEGKAAYLAAVYKNTR